MWIQPGMGWEKSVASGWGFSTASLGRTQLTPADLDEIRSRIGRALRTVQQVSGDYYETSYTAEGTDYVTRFRAIGVKAPEQLQDDFLNLFVWTWSLKDYLKACFKAKGLSAQDVEHIASGSEALNYVSDIANRAKHGTLRESRSGRYAELVGVGYDVLQQSIAKITVTGAEVMLHVKDPQLIRIRALVRTKTGQELEALAVLTEAIAIWEGQAIARVAP